MCLIAFVLGFLVARMFRGNGLSVGGEEEGTINIFDLSYDMNSKCEITRDVWNKNCSNTLYRQFNDKPCDENWILDMINSHCRSENNECKFNSNYGNLDNNDLQNFINENGGICESQIPKNTSNPPIK